MNKTKFSRLFAAVCLASVGMNPVWADTKTSSFQVGMSVSASCSLSASNLSFSNMPTGTTAGSDAATDITVTCSQGTPYQVSLSQGQNFSGMRRMLNGTSFINYELYSDPGRTNVWSTSQVVSFTGNGASQSHTVFGRVPAGQSVPNTGAYADTIVATISY
ncbi:MAG: SCPU domain-containing protein [Betaproteobacteria bacterium]|nr:SCPU domain-containing protein [Betaproteobacteria bacterium]